MRGEVGPSSTNFGQSRPDVDLLLAALGLTSTSFGNTFGASLPFGGFRADFGLAMFRSTRGCASDIHCDSSNNITPLIGPKPAKYASSVGTDLHRPVWHEPFRRRHAPILDDRAPPTIVLCTSSLRRGGKTDLGAGQPSRARPSRVGPGAANFAGGTEVHPDPSSVRPSPGPHLPTSVAGRQTPPGPRIFLTNASRGESPPRPQSMSVAVRRRRPD